VHTIDVLIPVAALVFLTVLLLPGIRNNPFWQASVTPLASIIGSGFLIAAPLLGMSVGSATPWAMLLIVVFAYWVGSVIRFNICHAEPREADGTASGIHKTLEQVSNLGLLGAYIISVAFYLRLMSAFVLRGFDYFTETNANVLTTAVLLFIGITGWRRGLKALEQLEEFSVSIKLAIIGAFFLGLALHDGSTGLWGHIPEPQEMLVFDTLRLLAGMLLVVQGFETSRYLGNGYSPPMRVRTMRFAQLLSGVIYVSFAFLILPLIQFIPPGQTNETGIIDLSRHVSVVLPVMLIFAAAMSQFSAAVADTLGGGGLIYEESRTRVSTGWGYLVLAGFAITLVWSTSIFEIIAYASRAFAFYYLSQTLLAFHLATTLPTGWRKGAIVTGFGVMAGLLAWIMVYAAPVG